MQDLVPKAWLLRWRFEFHDRPSRSGLWSNPGPVGNQAWHQNKEGLAYACIEGKNLKTKQTKILVRCKGEDFRNFQWIAANRSGVYTELVGMRMQTREKSVEIFSDGRCKVEDLPEGEKKTHFVTYGK